MRFGDHLAAAPDAAPADWLRATTSESHHGTVRSLVPAHFDSYLLVEAAPQGDRWWGRQRELLAEIAEVVGAFTTTPGTVWFAIWEGHGFERPGGDGLPTFSLPHRTYHLLRGEVGAAAEVRWPTWPHEPFRPDLWWPDDRAWFVATDVDFWCNYVGGTEAMADALAARLPDLCRPVSPDDALRDDD